MRNKFMLAILLCTLLIAVFAFSSVAAPRAFAATSRASAFNASCNFLGAELIYQRDQTHGNETRHVQLWYSPVSRCVWGVETNGQPGDEVWVFNKDTGNEEFFFIQSGHTGTTNELDDAGTQSHACMLPLYSDGTHGPQTCTPYF